MTRFLNNWAKSQKLNSNWGSSLVLDVTLEAGIKYTCSSLASLCKTFWKMFFLSLQDQLSADMYSFVAKEIDYASYFQTVSAASLLAEG